MATIMEGKLYWCCECEHVSLFKYSCCPDETKATIEFKAEGGRKDASLSGGDNEGLILKTEFPPFGWSKVNAKARMRGGHVFSAYIVRDAYLNLRYAKGWAVNTENVEAKDAVRMGEYKAMVEALSYCSENGIRRVWLEDDCSGVIRVVNDIAWLRGTMDKKYRCEFEKSRPQALMATGISRSCNIPARFMARCAHDFFEADDKEKRPPLCERRVDFHRWRILRENKLLLLRLQPISEHCANYCVH